MKYRQLFFSTDPEAAHVGLYSLNTASIHSLFCISDTFQKPSSDTSRSECLKALGCLRPCNIAALTVSGLQVFNNTPDETAFYRLTLEREGVQASMLMIQPTLTSFTFEGPPQPVLLDVASMRSDSPSAKPL